jgi:ABC-type Fe3+ transport system permease subunit
MSRLIALILALALTGCMTTVQFENSSGQSQSPFEEHLEDTERRIALGKVIFISGFGVLAGASAVGLSIPNAARYYGYRSISYEAATAIYWSSIGVGAAGALLAIFGYLYYGWQVDEYNDTMKTWIQYNNIRD